MNRRFDPRLLAVCAALALAFLWCPLPVAAEVAGTVELVRNFNEDGKFTHAVSLAFGEPVTVEAYLENEEGLEIDRWPELHLDASSAGVYNFPRQYSTTPSGRYTFYIVASSEAGETRVWSWTVNHTKKVSLTFAKTYKIRKADGTYRQVFQFNQTGGAGNTYHMEIYTLDGALIKSFEAVGKRDQGNWNWEWDYFPEAGLQIQSGTFIIKYWLGNGTPKQTTVRI